MATLSGQKRKTPRRLQHRPQGKAPSKQPKSKLQPHLANIQKTTVSNTASKDVADLECDMPRTPAATSISTMTVGPGELFNAFRVDEQSSLESYKQTMQYKLKDEIFRKMKFITNDAMMEFSMDKKSLCQYICCEMHIVGGQQGTFWKAVKDTVKRMIEKQRTNATSSCKRAFQGKWTETAMS